MNNKKTKKIILLVIMLFLIIFIIVGVSYAYTHANFFNVENSTTIAVNGGKMEIIYNDPETGGYSQNITADGIIPGWETTKLFTVTGTNEIDSNQTVDTNMYYKVGLVVEENTFSEGALKYELTPDNGDVTPTGQILNKLTGNVPQAGTEWFGMGYFVPSSNAVIHKYALKISFPETGKNQNIDKGKHFAGYVTITDEGEFVNLSVIVDREKPESNYNLSLLKNSGIFLETPVKQGYAFMGWNIVSGNASIEGNKLIVFEEQNIEIEAEWKNTGYVTLVLDLNGGISSDELNQRVYSNSIITLQTPTKEGNSFVNWELIQGEATITGNYIELKEKNVILKAIWVKDVYLFEYTGKEDYFVVPVTGNYQIEVWGGQGGTVSNTTSTAYGGYSTGQIHLSENEELFVNVGGKGESNCLASQNYVVKTCSGGYNGGGSGGTQDAVGRVGGGGGATHIAKLSGNLANLDTYATVCNSYSSECPILIVSGGGGGSGYWNYTSTQYGYGGAGGGISGVAGKKNSSTTTNAGTQTDGAAFGKGGNATGVNDVTLLAGGGGGYYGGKAATSNFAGGGGGSGYIGNPLLFDKSMYCYNCIESTENSTFTVNTKGTSNLTDTTNCPNGYSNNPVSKCAKAGDGYAKITYIGQ